MKNDNKLAFSGISHDVNGNFKSHIKNNINSNDIRNYDSNYDRDDDDELSVSDEINAKTSDSKKLLDDVNSIHCSDNSSLLGLLEAAIDSAFDFNASQWNDRNAHTVNEDVNMLSTFDRVQSHAKVFETPKIHSTSSSALIIFSIPLLQPAIYRIMPSSDLGTTSSQSSGSGQQVHINIQLADCSGYW